MGSAPGGKPPLVPQRLMTTAAEAKPPIGPRSLRAPPIAGRIQPPPFIPSPLGAGAEGPVTCPSVYILSAVGAPPPPAAPSHTNKQRRPERGARGVLRHPQTLPFLPHIHTHTHTRQATAPRGSDRPLAGRVSAGGRGARRGRGVCVGSLWGSPCGESWGGR